MSDGLTRHQVHMLLHRLDEMFEDIMKRSEQASADGAHNLASMRSMKAHGVHKAQLEVLRSVEISPTVWEQLHRRSAS